MDIFVDVADDHIGCPEPIIPGNSRSRLVDRHNTPASRPIGMGLLYQRLTPRTEDVEVIDPRCTVAAPGEFANLLQ